MAVPELALGRVEGAEEGGADHVFDADEAGIRGGCVVDEALADIWWGECRELVKCMTWEGWREVWRGLENLR